MVNCSIYIYRQSRAGYEMILDGTAGLGLEVLKTSSNGYADVMIEARDNAATRSDTTYKFDGKQYRESGTRLVNPQTGESKPASRRVQFKRGASSSTVQGTVTISLPDTYLIGARAGQVMTVQLTSPRKSVNFLVSSPVSTSRCRVTVRGPEIDHAFLLNDKRVLEEIQKILFPQGDAVSPEENEQPEPASEEEFDEFLRWLSKNLLTVSDAESFGELMTARSGVPRRVQRRLPNLARRFMSDVMKRATTTGRRRR